LADPRASEPVVNGPETPVEGALAALTAFGPEAGAFLDLDPALFGRALSAAAVGVAHHPGPAAWAGVRCALDLTRTGLAAALRAAGGRAAGPLSPDAADRRFADPAWEDNAGFFALRQSYLVLRQLAGDLVAAAELDDATRAKAGFAVDMLADALAPTNLLNN
jgi:polyhydroxyalkanoate synthase